MTLGSWSLLENTGAPGNNYQYEAKYCIVLHFTLSQTKGHVMQVKCKKLLDELTNLVTVTPSKICIEKCTDTQMARPGIQTRCPCRTFQARGIETAILDFIVIGTIHVSHADLDSLRMVKTYNVISTCVPSFCDFRFLNQTISARS